MFHDVIIVTGVFAWFGKPIDGVFLAALLSVIGFTVNDAVVVFDRICDEWARDTKSKFSDIANTAILNTLPRTVNTTIGGVFILATLAIFGGSSLRDFSIAMLVGLCSGVLATMFLAVPLAKWLLRMRRQIRRCSRPCVAFATTSFSSSGPFCIGTLR
jgi:SecD/SecF fusion protein